MNFSNQRKLLGQRRDYYSDQLHVSSFALSPIIRNIELNLV